MTKWIPALLIVSCSFSLSATVLDTNGVTLLQQTDPTLTGAGVRVAQPEAVADANDNDFEVNPAQVGQPVDLFTYISTNLESATGFPNSVGSESSHADGVAAGFYGLVGLYGIYGGVATNVAHVDNYNVNYFALEEVMVVDFITNYVVTLPSTNIDDPVVNQSYDFVDYVDDQYVHVGSNEEVAIDLAFDNYAAEYNTLFVSGAGNGGVVNPPATCYNGLGVGLYGGNSSFGPTIDNGRCKPDLVAVAPTNTEDTSYSTPYVAGSAAVLIQAGSRGDGGPNTNAATDLRALRAFLLNGAVKPTDWTNGTSAPLDARYGAGMLNLFNSWEQMKGGQHVFIESSSITSGAPHPPGAITNNEPVPVGWDYNSISTSSFQDTVNHYYFNLPGGIPFTLTATLEWNKQTNQTTINHLDLFLYNTANSNLVTCSTSQVDNVQHIFLPVLPAGRYDLQVLKQGSLNQVSAAETYALAFEMFNMTLCVQWTNGNAIISWPLAPTGFQLQSAASLSPPVAWTPVTNAAAITTNRNMVILSPGAGAQFFQLVRPAF